MNGGFDETALTAYALGEVTDEQARAIEARLETDEEARAFVDGQRELAASLEEAMGGQVGAGLDSGRRDRVLDDVAGRRGILSFDLIRAAAVVFLCVSLAAVWASSLPEREALERGREVAAGERKDAPTSESRFEDEGRKARSAGREAEKSTHSEFDRQAPGVVDALKLDIPGVPVTRTIELGDELMPARLKGADVHTIVPDATSNPTDGVYSIGASPAGSGTPGGGGPPAGLGGASGPPVDAPGAAGYTRKAAPGSRDQTILRDAAVVGGTAAPAAKAPAPAGGVTGRVAPTFTRNGELAKNKTTVEALERRRGSGRRSDDGHDTEQYGVIDENEFLSPEDSPLSTLSIDVDTASYANVRRFLNGGRLPPPDAVRIEELVNYFNYDDPAPDGEDPFAVTTEVAACPWNLRHRLMRVGMKARSVDMEGRSASNLVFLLDVSGSMNSPDKLPLLQQAMKMLVDSLDERDTVSIVVYAGSSGLVLPPTNGARKGSILGALEQLRAGGSTNGAAGIHQAYATATSRFIKGGTNRVIWCTDGDLNVGVTDQGSLVRMIKEKAATGVFLSVLGFGSGNLKDSTLEQVANKGNGAYAYIDSVREARKVLVEEMGGTLITVAKDVKIQVEFNPAVVGSYRLIGYENRLLAARDFNDDRKDAGEIGSGHSIVALYEVAPRGSTGTNDAGIDPLKYQGSRQVVGGGAGEIGTVKLRFKQPDGDVSTKREFLVHDTSRGYAEASIDFKLAASVAAFGMVLRSSAHRGTASMAMIHELAGETLTRDLGGYRAEFMDLVDRAAALLARRPQ